jgi:hypothetical protein
VSGGKHPTSYASATLQSRVSTVSSAEGKRVIAFCPECLKQDVPFYRRSWCLEYFTICGTHPVPFHKACPECRGLVRFERLAPDRSFTSCHNCGFELRRTSTHHYEATEALATVLAHQDRLTRLLEGARQGWLRWHAIEFPFSILALALL